MTDEYKRLAAWTAVEEIASGMVLGLGHGSTALFALTRLAELLREGTLRDIVGIPCSQQVAATARELGIPLTTLETHPVIDLTIDGADEVSPELNLIKGGGGALLREKIVAEASRREIIIIDESKWSEALGTLSTVPVEVVPFGWSVQQSFLASLGATVTLRVDADSAPRVTDQGNYLLDCDFGPIALPAILANRLHQRTGVVEHGLFIRLASEVIVAGKAGVQRYAG